MIERLKVLWRTRRNLNPQSYSRSATVALAVTLAQLASSKSEGWTEDQELVLTALRRSAKGLNDATDEELSRYILRLSPEALQGVANNVKGIFHELLIRRAENLDGDNVTAELFELTNHPGVDLKFVMDGRVIREVQAKAVDDPHEIVAHFSQYPDVDVLVTEETFEKVRSAFGGQVESSSFSNSEITRETVETLEALSGENCSELFGEGHSASILLTGALRARDVLEGKPLDKRKLRDALEVAGVAAGTAATVDALLNLI